MTTQTTTSIQEWQLRNGLGTRVIVEVAADGSVLQAMEICGSADRSYWQKNPLFNEDYTLSDVRECRVHVVVATLR